MPPVRRLTAILAADAAGYSRLMGADEEGTHARLQGHLRELIDPKIAEHRGRVGTLVALALALDHPEALSGLVLLSGYYLPTLRADVPLFSLPAIPFRL